MDYGYGYGYGCGSKKTQTQTPNPDSHYDLMLWLRLNGFLAATSSVFEAFEVLNG